MPQDHQPKQKVIQGKDDCFFSDLFGSRTSGGNSTLGVAKAVKRKNDGKEDGTGFKYQPTRSLLRDPNGG